VHGDSAAAAEPTHSELVDEVDATNQTTGPVTPGMRTSPLVENLHAPDGDSALSNRKLRKKVGRQDAQPKVSRQNDHSTDVDLAVNGFPLAKREIASSTAYDCIARKVSRRVVMVLNNC